MKKFLMLTVFILLLGAAGCSSTVSSFDYGDNWLIRENDIPQYFSQFDLFYLGKPPVEYGDTYDVRFNWAKTHTNDTFKRGVRVFAPNITDPTVNDVAEALTYYLEKFHKPGHPFILLAEGSSAELLYQAMKECDNLTVPNGFVAAYLPDMEPRTAEAITRDFSWDNLFPAKNANQFGVIITWHSCINNDHILDKRYKKGIYNINPLNWKTDGVPGSAMDNKVSIFYMPRYKNQYWRKVEEKNLCGAVINLERGVLEIKSSSRLLHCVNDEIFTDNSISLFAGNIVENAKLRTRNLIRYRQWKGTK